MNFFTEENIIESFMYYYKDFNYVEYVINLPIDKSLILLDQCIQRIKDQHVQHDKDRSYHLWLLEIQHGCKITNFNKWYEQALTKSKGNISYEDRDKEEKRIIDKINKIKGGVKKIDSNKGRNKNNITSK